MKTTFNLLRTFALFFLLLCLFGSSFASVSSPLTEMNPEEAVSLSIQLNTRTIQASSREEQTFPLLLSSKINKLDLSSFSRNPVDLVCVFKIQHDKSSHSPSLTSQIEEIQNLLKDLQPLMTDQDRLAIVLFYNPCSTESLFPAIDNLATTKIPSLTSTTAQNWETIIQTIGENMIEQDISARNALEAATKILNKRTEANRTTGVFIASNLIFPESPKNCEGQLMEEMDLAKRDAEVQDEKWIIQIFPDEPKELSQAFAESLVALRAGIVETQLFLKPEKSEVLGHFKIDSPYFNPYCKGWEKENGGIVKRSLSAKSGTEEESAFELMIPRIAAQDLSSSPTEVKVFSYQLLFLLNNGSQVSVKNADLMVKIVREGEKVVDEEETEVVRDFYHKWGKDWMIPTAWMEAWHYDYKSALQTLKRYRESLDSSIVKDDEMLQKMWKDARAEILYDQEMGMKHDW